MLAARIGLGRGERVGCESASTFPDRAWAEPPSHLRAYPSTGEKLEDDDSRSWLPVWMPLFHKFASGALRYSKEGCRVVGGGGEGRTQAA